MTTNSIGAYKENFNLNIWYYAFTKNGTKNILTIDFDDGDIRRYSIANQIGSNIYFYLNFFTIS